MRRYLMTLVAVALTTLGVKAMPYEMAREEAMYLTDKMAYELNLNQMQYEYAYEINLDYLMSLNRAEDAYGMYLTFRNADLRSILYDWQWNVFAAVEYFHHPVSWRYGSWYYPIYGFYARNYYYYTRPNVYHNYRGGHGRGHYANGFYGSRRPAWDGGFRGSDRGHYGHPNGHPGSNGYSINFGGRPNGGNQGGYTPNGGRPNGGNQGGYTPNGGRPNGGNQGGYTPNGGRPNGGNQGGYTPNGGRPNGGNQGGYTPNGGRPNGGNQGGYTPNGGRSNGEMRSSSRETVGGSRGGNTSAPSRGSGNAGATAGRGHSGGRGGR